MNRAIFWLRQTLIVFLATLMFLTSNAFGQQGYSLEARAEPVTPEATEYQVDHTDSQIRVDTGKIEQKARNTAKKVPTDTQQATRNAKKSVDTTDSEVGSRFK